MNPAESSWPQNPETYPPPTPAAPAPPPGPSPEAADGVLRKSPRLAFVLSAFPGLGNVYNGLYLRGLIQFLIVAGLMGVVDGSRGPFFPMTMIFFWAFNALDAYRQAVLINYGYSRDLGLLDRPAAPKAGQGGLAAGILLTVVGLIAFAEEYFDFDLSWLYDLWPLVLVGIGLWLIVSSARELAKSRAQDS